MLIELGIALFFSSYILEEEESVEED